MIENNDKMPQDSDFQTLLSHYSAPVEEDGFSQSVLQSLDALQNHSLYPQAFIPASDRLRLYSLSLAGLTGLLFAFDPLITALGSLYGKSFSVLGTLKAIKAPRLADIIFDSYAAAMSSFTIKLEQADLSILNLDMYHIMIAALLCLALWALIDNKASELL